ncbi:MAG: hypothetical protein NTW03_00150 [Verrucomicrobia bacterium]|nr:hypothetical protein [Verrucomicrobiota bacterium]
MEAIRGLLETLEFQVDVFDGPDMQRPPFSVFQQRIDSAECMVLLLGPKLPQPGGTDAEPAEWPFMEAVYALGKEKPLAVIVHPGTRVPDALREYQTPARFDFWQPASFLKSAHHVVKHLLDLKRRVDLPPGTQPFVFTKAVLRNKIQRSGRLRREAYHEVVVREPVGSFRHSLDTGLDKTQDAKIELASPDAYEVEATLGGTAHTLECRFGDKTTREMWYYVDVRPPLMPGEKLGYRREFEIKNYFPLTSAELNQRAAQDGFPDLYKVDGRTYYGYVYDVRFEMESISLAIHFPRRVQIRSYRAVVFIYGSKQVSRLETDRCLSPDQLTLDEPVDGAQRVLALNVRRPLSNHSYVLLYEPGGEEYR